MLATVNNKKLKTYILKWISFWFLAMGFFVFILKPNGFDYLENTPVSTFYFLFMASIGAYLFQFRELISVIAHLKKQLILFAVVSIAFLFLPILIDKYFPLSEGVQQFLISNKILYPFFTLRSSMVKLADIIFQQTLIICLALYLKSIVSDKKVGVGIFTGVFFLLHIPLFIHFGVVALTFILPSLFGGFLFAYFIFYYKQGPLYSILTHMFFYFCLGIGLRMI